MKASINGRRIDSPVKQVTPPSSSEVVLIQSAMSQTMLCVRVPTGGGYYVFAFIGGGRTTYCLIQEFAYTTRDYIELSRCPIDSLEVNFNA